MPRDRSLRTTGIAGFCEAQAVLAGAAAQIDDRGAQIAGYAGFDARPRDFIKAIPARIGIDVVVPVRDAIMIRFVGFEGAARFRQCEWLRFRARKITEIVRGYKKLGVWIRRR